MDYRPLIQEEDEDEDGEEEEGRAERTVQSAPLNRWPVIRPAIR